MLDYSTIQDLPVAIQALLMICGTVLMTVTLSWLVVWGSTRRFPDLYVNLVPNVCGALMAGFALFSALIASTVIRDGVSGLQAVELEAKALPQAIQIVDHARFPGWHDATQRYIALVIDEEWQDMRAGKLSRRADAALRELKRQASIGLTGLEADVRHELQVLVGKIETNRELRLISSIDEIPQHVWTSLLLSAVVATMVSAACHYKSVATAAYYAAMLGIFMGTTFFSILAMDHPFSGRYGISPELIAQAATRGPDFSSSGSSVAR